MRLQRVAHEGAVAGLEDVQGQERAREEHRLRQGEERERGEGGRDVVEAARRGHALP